MICSFSNFQEQYLLPRNKLLWKGSNFVQENRKTKFLFCGNYMLVENKQMNKYKKVTLCQGVRGAKKKNSRVRRQWYRVSFGVGWLEKASEEDYSVETPLGNLGNFLCLTDDMNVRPLGYTESARTPKDIKWTEGLRWGIMKNSYQMLPVLHSAMLSSLGHECYRGGSHLVPVIMTDENRVPGKQICCISKPQRKELGLI